VPPRKFKHPPFWSKRRHLQLTSIQNIIRIHQTVQKLHPSKRSPRWNDKSDVIGFEVIINGITCLPNFIKIQQSFQKLFVGDTQTDTQTGDLISYFHFWKVRLKSKAFPLLAMQVLRWRGSITPTHSWLGTSRGRVVSVTPWPSFTPGWASELVWTQRLEEKSFCLGQRSNPDRPICSQTLFWSNYPSFFRGAPVSSIWLQTYYPDWGFVFLRPSRQYWRSALN
jgi:hypothetical protein